MIGYAIIRFGLTYYRQEVVVLWGLQEAQVIAVITGLVALGFLIWRDVVEPATGSKLGTVGFAAISDLKRSALRARAAQASWAAAPFKERAAVMRRGAGALGEVQRQHPWLIRESGG